MTLIAKYSVRTKKGALLHIGIEVHVYPTSSIQMDTNKNSLKDLVKARVGVSQRMDLCLKLYLNNSTLSLCAKTSAIRQSFKSQYSSCNELHGHTSVVVCKATRISFI